MHGETNPHNPEMNSRNKSAQVLTTRIYEHTRTERATGARIRSIQTPRIVSACAPHRKHAGLRQPWERPAESSGTNRGT